MKEIRATYREKAADTAPSLLSLLSGKGARSSVASKKRKINEERDRLLTPYAKIVLTIDDVIVKLDGGKLQIERRMNALNS